MKILFSADLHIELDKKNIPESWAINRYTLLFNKLAELSAQVDLTILGGDIFDKTPSMQELELYFDLIRALNSDTIIYPGNHEATKKDKTFLSYLRKITEWANTSNKMLVIDDYYVYNDTIDFIPYTRLKEYASTKNYKFSSRILCTHVRGDIPPYVKAEVPLEIFDSWDVVLTGDLHSHSNSQRNLIYPGSPVTTSFHRDYVETGVIILDTDTLKYEWIKLDLPQLIRKTIKVGEELVQGDKHHIIYEVEGSMSELHAIEDNALLDKKVLKREQDTALILDPSMSLVQEVREYLEYILQLDDKTIESSLKELNTYVPKIS